MAKSISIIQWLIYQLSKCVKGQIIFTIVYLHFEFQSKRNLFRKNTILPWFDGFFVSRLLLKNSILSPILGFWGAATFLHVELLWINFWLRELIGIFLNLFASIPIWFKSLSNFEIELMIVVEFFSVLLI